MSRWRGACSQSCRERWADLSCRADLCEALTAEFGEAPLLGHTRELVSGNRRVAADSRMRSTSFR